MSSDFKEGAEENPHVAYTTLREMVKAMERYVATGRAY